MPTADTAAIHGDRDQVPAITRNSLTKVDMPGSEIADSAASIGLGEASGLGNVVDQFSFVHS